MTMGPEGSLSGRRRSLCQDAFGVRDPAQLEVEALSAAVSALEEVLLATPRRVSVEGLPRPLPGAQSLLGAGAGGGRARPSPRRPRPGDAEAAAAPSQSDAAPPAGQPSARKAVIVDEERSSICSAGSGGAAPSSGAVQGKRPGARLPTEPSSAFVAAYATSEEAELWCPAWSDSPEVQAARAAHSRVQKARRQELSRMIDAGHADLAARAIDRRGRKRQEMLQRHVVAAALKAMCAQRRELAETRQLLENVVANPRRRRVDQLRADLRFTVTSEPSASR